MSVARRRVIMFLLIYLSFIVISAFVLTSAVFSEPAVIQYPEFETSTTQLSALLDNGKLIGSWAKVSTQSMTIVPDAVTDSRLFTITLNGKPVIVNLKLPAGLKVSAYKQIVAFIKNNSSAAVSLQIILKDSQGSTWLSNTPRAISKTWMPAGEAVLATRFKLRAKGPGITGNPTLNLAAITEVWLQFNPVAQTGTLILSLKSFILSGASLYNLPARETAKIYDFATATVSGQTVNINSDIVLTVTSNATTALAITQVQLPVTTNSLAITLSGVSVSKPIGYMTLTASRKVAGTYFQLADFNRLVSVCNVALSGSAAPATGNLRMTLVDSTGKSFKTPAIPLTNGWKSYSANLVDGIFVPAVSGTTPTLNRITKVILSLDTRQNLIWSIAGVSGENELYILSNEALNGNLKLKLRSLDRLGYSANAQINLCKAAVEAYSQPLNLVSQYQSESSFVQALLTGWNTATHMPYVNAANLTEPNGFLVGGYVCKPASLGSQITLAQAYVANNNLKVASVKPRNLSVDVTPPEIDRILVDNKVFWSGDFTGKNPVITVDLSDDQPGDSKIAAYAITLKRSDNTVIASPGNNYAAEVPTASITFPAGALTAGSYDLQIVVRDKQGNTTTANHTLSVAEGLAVSGLMSGPNPFNPDKQSAAIQYQLSQPADVHVYIYSISGERQWETAVASGDYNGGSVGFNKILWDGRNQWNETVANGVYVCYLIAASNGEKVVKKHKIAVLR